MESPHYTPCHRMKEVVRNSGRAHFSMFVEFNCTLVHWWHSPSNKPGLLFSELGAGAVSWWFMLCSSHSIALEVVPLKTVVSATFEGRGSDTPKALPAGDTFGGTHSRELSLLPKETLKCPGLSPETQCWASEKSYIAGETDVL